MSFFEGNASNSKKPPRVQSNFWKCNVHLLHGKTWENEIELIESTFRPLCNKFVFGEEFGENGNTPHIEGYLWFNKKTEFQSIQKLYKWDDLRKSSKKLVSAGLEYCQKEGNRILEHGLPKKLKTLACENNLFSWQKVIVDIVSKDPDDRTIYWFYERNGGVGKTTFCKYLVRFYNAIVLGGKSCDMKNGIIEYQKTNLTTPELIIVNIPRSFDSNYLSYTGIEECKDMLFYSGKYEGGMVDGNPPHLIVFSNKFPDIKKISKDRWKIYNITNDNYINLEDYDHSDDDDLMY